MTLPDLDDILAASNIGATDPTLDLDAILAGPQDTEPDPLADVEYTDDLGADAAAELTALEQAYRNRARGENDRYRAATDSEFWFAVCFKSRDEKDRFLKASGLAKLGDKYLLGRAVADHLGIRTD